MAIGINDLDDDDVIINNPTQNGGQPSQQQEDDFMVEYLKSKGIDDTSKINFEDDNGNIVTRDWKDLTKEERINILNTPVEDLSHQLDNNDLSEDELRFIQLLRQSQMTPEQYIQSLTVPVEQEPTYKIDDLSDDELYILDLESRVGELDDDAAAQALAVAKQNEDLYSKQVEGIRKEYKEREDYQTQLMQAEREEELQEAFRQYLDNVVNAIDSFNSIGNLDLNFEDADKEELAEFMLSQDENGRNYLYLALQDPETLVKAAWFILNGDDAFNNVADYFINLIKLVSENQYKKGLEDGKNGVVSRPSVVINKPTSRQQKTYKTVEDLDDED